MDILTPPSHQPAPAQSQSPTNTRTTISGKKLTSSRSAKRTLTPFQGSLLTRMDRVSEIMQQPQDDPDRMYLLSLLPAFKHLSEANKWRFRQAVANFFISLDVKYPPSQQLHTQFAPPTIPQPHMFNPTYSLEPVCVSTVSSPPTTLSQDITETQPQRLSYQSLLDPNFDEY